MCFACSTANAKIATSLEPQMSMSFMNAHIPRHRPIEYPIITDCWIWSEIDIIWGTIFRYLRCKSFLCKTLCMEFRYNLLALMLYQCGIFSVRRIWFEFLRPSSNVLVSNQLFTPSPFELKCYTRIKIEHGMKGAAWVWDANNPSLFILSRMQAAVSVKSNDSA